MPEISCERVEKPCLKSLVSRDGHPVDGDEVRQDDDQSGEYSVPIANYDNTARAWLKWPQSISPPQYAVILRFWEVPVDLNTLIRSILPVVEVDWPDRAVDSADVENHNRLLRQQRTADSPDHGFEREVDFGMETSRK